MSRVRLNEIKKSFSGNPALSGVSFDIRAGEVLALVGENGAGKSTLMKILSGIYAYGTSPDSYKGTIEIDGKEIRFATPRDAEDAGIAIIHQELSAFPHLTIEENLLVGHWPTKGFLVDAKAMREKARALFRAVDPEGAEHLSFDQSMSTLSTGRQQLVEIAKAAGRGAKVLILDEPTSSLTPQEVSRLHVLLRRLRDQGTALVYISHKMDEIFSLCDRVAVLRDGRSVHLGATKDLDEKKLIELMVGRPLDQQFPPRPKRAMEKTRLAVRSLAGEARTPTQRNVGPFNFELREGEILGLAGLLGAGRTELAHLLIGAMHETHAVSGEIELDGKKFAPKDVRAAATEGIVIVAEDRKRDSNLSGRSLEENSALAKLNLGLQLSWVEPNDALATANDWLKRLKTRFADVSQPIDDLSGGNQQKVILSRALRTQPKVLILDEPSRGVDVGARFEIVQILFEIAAQGTSLIVTSSDLPELIGLCDRVLVLSEGKQVGELADERITQENIMSLAVKKTEDTRNEELKT